MATGQEDTFGADPGCADPWSTEWTRDSQDCAKVHFCVQVCSSLSLSLSATYRNLTFTSEIKDPSVKNPELKGSPFKAWSVGQYIAMHATPTARDFFLANFYPSGPFTCMFSKTSPEFFLCWLWLTPVLVWARRVREVLLLLITDNWCRFPGWMPTKYK